MGIRVMAVEKLDDMETALVDVEMDIDDTPEKQERFESEVRIFQTKWANELDAGDPYYNPDLSLERPDFFARQA